MHDLLTSRFPNYYKLNYWFKAYGKVNLRVSKDCTDCTVLLIVLYCTVGLSVMYYTTL